MEKKRQTNSAGRRKIWKFSIPALRSVENTSVSMTIIASGFSSDQTNPSKEFRYLSLNSLIVRFLTSSVYLGNAITHRATYVCFTEMFSLFLRIEAFSIHIEGAWPFRAFASGTCLSYAHIGHIA